MLWRHVVWADAAREGFEVKVKPQEHMVGGEGDIKSTEASCFDLWEGSWCAEYIIDHSHASRSACKWFTAHDVLVYIFQRVPIDEFGKICLLASIVVSVHHENYFTSLFSLF